MPLRRLLDHRDAGLGNHGRVAAGAIGRAHGAVGVFRVEAHVHARLVVGARDQVPEYVEDLAFELAREILVAPSLAHEALGAGAVALQQQRARKRELALGGGGSFPAEMRPHGRGIEAVLPERRLGAAPQEADARPARIFGDEGDIAGVVDLVVVAAQDRPLDQLACDRIADRALQLACPRRFAFARLRDRLLDGGNIGRGGRRRGSDGERRLRGLGTGDRAGGVRFRCRGFVLAGGSRRRPCPSALPPSCLSARRLCPLALPPCPSVRQPSLSAPRPCPSARGSKPARPSGHRPRSRPARQCRGRRRSRARSKIAWGPEQSSCHPCCRQVAIRHLFV